MQKKIIALAIAAVFAAPATVLAAAHGAGGVTVYGSFDGGIRHQTNNTATTTAGGTTDSMTMGHYNSNRWGIKATEDLGDGMKSNVVIEGSLLTPGVAGSAGNPNGLVFDRQATIGLEGGFGKFDMGWDYTVLFTANVKYDPLGYKFLSVGMARPGSISIGTTTVLADRANSMSYTNKFGDISVRAQYQMTNAQAATQPTTGAGRAIGVDYAAGPISVGVSYTAIESPTSSHDASQAIIGAGAGFNFGDGTVKVGYTKRTAQTKTTPATVSNEAINSSMWAGVSYNVSSKIGATFAYYRNADNLGSTTAPTTAVAGSNDTTRTRAIVAATYALSKRTTAYFEMDRSTANDGKLGLVGTNQGEDAVASGSAIGLAVTF